MFTVGILLLRFIFDCKISWGILQLIFDSHLPFSDKNRNRKAVAGQAVCGMTHILAQTAIVVVVLVLMKCTVC